MESHQTNQEQDNHSLRKLLSLRFVITCDPSNTKDIITNNYN